ncbi:alpha-E domain-containing protein, partial [Streptococcus suis]
MLSRTAAALYWLGRYVERAEFTAQLVEATLRLDQLAARGLAGVRLAVDLGVREAEAQHAGVVDLRLDPRRDVEAVEPVTP